MLVVSIAQINQSQITIRDCVQ